MPRKALPNAKEIRREKVAANVRAFRLRAAYVTPSVTLDTPHAAALRRHMKREKLDVSDAIRSAILAAGAPAPRKPRG